MSISYNTAVIKSVSEINTISQSFKEFENAVEETYVTKDEAKYKYATKDSVKVLRNYTKGRFNKLKGEIDMEFDVIKDGLKQSVETANKILERISDPTLPGYKQSWNELKMHLVTLRDMYYSQKRMFEDKCTDDLFYKFFHYREYKQYLIYCELFRQIQNILSRIENLEIENIGDNNE